VGILASALTGTFYRRRVACPCSINPVTGTDWEGVGVTTDVAVEAAKAMNVAQVRILREFLAAEKDPGLRERIEKRIAELG
jgi:hypothetical protein